MCPTSTQRSAPHRDIDVGQTVFNGISPSLDHFIARQIAFLRKKKSIVVFILVFCYFCRQKTILPATMLQVFKIKI